MVSFFPDRVIANLDERKDRITIRHLASNRNGFESGCLAGDEPTLDKMRSKPDWVQAALDRRVVKEPGTDFCYDSPGMHLLSAILQKATGMTALEFARQNLFEPLASARCTGNQTTGLHPWLGRLHLKPRDSQDRLSMAQWRPVGGKQIVSAPG
jgi:CubicO group peptidase (beta-lactamase class C family)